MIIAIDDSGGPGLKPGRGVSSYFSIAAVYFKNDEDADKTKAKIDLLKKRLGWKQKREFKFRKTNREFKTLFFNAIKHQNFEISVVLLEKDKMNRKDYYKNPSKLYNAAILRAIQGLGIELADSHIYIDGEAGNDYRKKAKTFFRQNLPKGAIKELSYIDSVDNSLIQLADMVVGAVRYTLEDKPDSDEYFHMIKKHITTLTRTI